MEAQRHPARHASRERTAGVIGFLHITSQATHEGPSRVRFMVRETRTRSRIWQCTMENSPHIKCREQVALPTAIYGTASENETWSLDCGTVAGSLQTVMLTISSYYENFVPAENMCGLGSC